MSCRVLGRKVEQAMLRELTLAARAASVRWIIGRYIPTAKNGMVKVHYAKLGFDTCPIGTDAAAGETAWLLDVTAIRLPPYP
jgi:predicted enzyme involved in methoxymalonyl-ACP biosynthesis